MPTIIETPRILFRLLNQTDAQAMFTLDSDEAVHKYLGQNPIYTIAESVENISNINNQYIENGIGRWAVIEKQSGNFIGWGGLKLITEETNKHINYYDLGYRLIRQYWGKGYATEIASATLSYAYEVLNQTEIFVIADINNKASIHILEKVGFKKLEIFEYNNAPHYWFMAEKINCIISPNL